MCLMPSDIAPEPSCPSSLPLLCPLLADSFPELCLSFVSVCAKVAGRKERFVEPFTNFFFLKRLPRGPIESTELALQITSPGGHFRKEIQLKSIQHLITYCLFLAPPPSPGFQREHLMKLQVFQSGNSTFMLLNFSKDIPVQQRTIPCF